MKAQISIVLSLLLSFAQASASQDIIEDGGVGMSREELEFIVKNWTPQMQEAAATDPGDRIELLNMTLAAKKIAREADALTPEADGELYWKRTMLLRTADQRFILDQFMASLKVPDMSALAQERFLTEKDKYALVPEQRLSSQILFLCKAMSDCDRKAIRPVAEKVLTELNGGANFEEMVETYSGDPGSKPRQGKFPKWIARGEPNILPQYVAGLYGIDKVGGYSGIVETEVGYHIIRLDEIQPAHYQTFEEAKPAIVQALEKEYRLLAAKGFDARYRLTEKARMDTKALDEIFAPYKTAE
jgi:hypothetical protein